MKSVKLIKVFIASPNDVSKQRNEIEDIIMDWNYQNADDKNIVLLPVRWEKNSTASYRLNESGQAVINKDLVLSSDLLIAIFGNRMGTVTSSGKSGTIEEIKVFNESNEFGSGIFFVNDNIVPDDLIEEKRIVLLYKEHLSKTDKGLYQDYSKRNIYLFLNKNVHKLTKGSNNESDLDIFDNLEFDSDEQLLMIFSVEEEIYQFGSRWMAQEYIDKIKNWEINNNLMGYLSSRYENTLDKLLYKELIKTEEYTSYGNPRLYIYEKKTYINIKSMILNNPTKVAKIKEKLINDDIEETETVLPF